MPHRDELPTRHSLHDKLRGNEDLDALPSLPPTPGRPIQPGQPLEASLGSERLSGNAPQHVTVRLLIHDEVVRRKVGRLEGARLLHTEYIAHGMLPLTEPLMPVLLPASGSMQDGSVSSQRGDLTPEPLPNGNAASDPRPCARKPAGLRGARAEGRTVSERPCGAWTVPVRRVRKQSSEDAEFGAQ